MRTPMRRGIATAGIATALVLGAIGCGGPSAVDRDEVAATTSTALREQGVQVEGMACPGDLPAVTGATLRCAFSTGGQPVDAVVTVTSVQDGRARFDVHTEARPVAKALLGRKVAELLRDQAAVAVDSSDCAADLPPRVGESVSCDVTSGGERTQFAVTVTSVDGGLINFSVEQV